MTAVSVFDVPDWPSATSQVGVIENEFRTLPMEIIAGEDNLDVEVRFSCSQSFGVNQAQFLCPFLHYHSV